MKIAEAVALAKLTKDTLRHGTTMALAENEVYSSGPDELVDRPIRKLITQSLFWLMILDAPYYGTHELLSNVGSH